MGVSQAWPQKPWWDLVEAVSGAELRVKAELLAVRMQEEDLLTGIWGAGGIPRFSQPSGIFSPPPVCESVTEP